MEVYLTALLTLYLMDCHQKNSCALDFSIYSRYPFMNSSILWYAFLVRTCFRFLLHIANYLFSSVLVVYWNHKCSGIENYFKVVASFKAVFICGICHLYLCIFFFLWTSWLSMIVIIVRAVLFTIICFGSTVNQLSLVCLLQLVNGWTKQSRILVSGTVQLQ